MTGGDPLNAKVSALDDRVGNPSRIERLDHG
jgi:hypothetical protein